MKTFAQTNRLILREILMTDLDAMFELDADPDVHKYLGNKPVTDKTQIADAINFIRQQYIDNGIGRWAIVEKQSNRFIGWAGLKFVTELTNNHKDYYDLGYRLIQKYWGKGFATEAAIASLRYAFDNLNTDKVYAIADCENVGSNKILQKIGFELIEKFNLDGTEHNWYEIEKMDFEQKSLK